MDKIFTKRLIIQKATIEDVGALDSLLADRELCQLAHLIVPADPVWRAQSLALLINSMVIYLLRLQKGPEQFIGMVMVDQYYDHTGLADKGKREIGYLLVRSFWNQGLMTEALQSLVPLFIRNYSLIGITDCTNQASQKVLSRVGFQQVGSSGEQIIWKNRKNLH